MSKLVLSSKLSLPIDAVTQTIGILAKRRAGKSYTARRFTEQLVKAKQQVVIVDPKGDWWGIRSAADGHSPGLPITILGGERGDVPLEVGAGEVIAKLAAEERVSMLLDLSLFRKYQVAEFMTAFLENLYRIKAKEEFRTAMMLVLDEADAIAPQNPYEKEKRMLGAAEDIVRRGGQRGIGCTMITQRSAVLNKNVLTQCEILVALRTISPQDLAALNAWIDVHGTQEQRHTLMESLPALPTGDAWVWSPGWPTANGIFQRVKVCAIETFDSGATPRPGEKRKEPKNVADVDLDALRKTMAATIERAKANDPRELKAEVARLKAELAKKPATAIQQVKESLKRVEVPVLKDGQLARAERIVTRVEELFEKQRNSLTETFRAQNATFGELAGTFSQVVAPISAALVLIRRPVPPQPVVPTVSRSQPAQASRPAPAPPAPVKTATDGTDDLPPRRQRILDALAFYESIGQMTPAREWAAFFCDTSPNSSTYEKDLGAMRTAGLIVYPNAGLLQLTPDGRGAARPAEAITLSQFHDKLLNLLEPRRKRILRILIDAYPNELRRDQLAEKVVERFHEKCSADSSTFEKDLGAMRTAGLLVYPQSNYAKAADLVFPPLPA